MDAAKAENFSPCLREPGSSGNLGIERGAWLALSLLEEELVTGSLLATGAVTGEEMHLG